MKNRYQKEKARIRELAIRYQVNFSNHNYSYSEIVYYQNTFHKLGKRYGLLREFHENGIC